MGALKFVKTELPEPTHICLNSDLGVVTLNLIIHNYVNVSSIEAHNYFSFTHTK